MNNFSWGSYYPVDSWVHRLDPRAKITGIFFFLITIFFANSYPLFVLLYAFAFFLIKLANIPFKQILRSIRFIAFLAVLTGIFNMFFTPGEIVLQLGFLKITEEGIYQGGLMILRLILLVGFSSILTYTTSPVQLTDGLEAIFAPFQRFGLPSHDLALMISLSLRFIPILMLEATNIVKAQRARGADVYKVKNVIALVVPLFASALQRAEDLATAMDARGYKGGEGRTKYHQLKWTKNDNIFILLIAIMSLIIIAFRYL